MVNLMVPSGHIGVKPTVKIAISEARNLLLEGDSQARLQLSSHPEQSRGHGELHCKPSHNEQNYSADHRHALHGCSKFVSKVQQATKEQSLDHDPDTGNQERSRYAGRSQHAIGLEQSK